MVTEGSVHSCLAHELGQNIMAVGVCGREALYLMVDRKQRETGKHQG
jgi:hypothetical protein